MVNAKSIPKGASAWAFRNKIYILSVSFERMHSLPTPLKRTRRRRRWLFFSTLFLIFLFHSPQMNVHTPGRKATRYFATHKSNWEIDWKKLNSTNAISRIFYFMAAVKSLHSTFICHSKVSCSKLITNKKHHYFFSSWSHNFHLLVATLKFETRPFFQLLKRLLWRRSAMSTWFSHSLNGSCGNWSCSQLDLRHVQTDTARALAMG